MVATGAAPPDPSTVQALPDVERRNAEGSCATLGGMGSFQYVPHRRAAERASAGPVTTHGTMRSMGGDGRLARLNAAIGLRITVVVGTMWCAYLFSLLALVSAPAALTSGNALVVIAWIAQTFLQLVLLPIIIVGQNVQAESADRRSRATYEDTTMILDEVRQMQAHLLAQDAAFQDLRSEVLRLRHER